MSCSSELSMKKSFKPRGQDELKTCYNDAPEI